MAGTSKLSKRVSVRLPNEVFDAIQRRIDGRRGRWESVALYVQERIIYDVMRPHKKVRRSK